MPQSRVERAAGGLVIRVRNGEREVLLIDDAYGQIAFPKGHVDPGETWEDAAVREIAEETGITARILCPLGRVHYTFERNDVTVDKQVRLYLMEAVDGEEVPRHQAEEVNGAYFLPWDEAVRAQHSRGYENWNWIFQKADAMWDWHTNDWENRWRQLPNSTNPKERQEAWGSVRPALQRLVDAVEGQLTQTASFVREALQPVPPLPEFPVAVEREQEALRDAIEHTLLKPEASAVDVLNLCREAATHGFRAVCVNPQHVSLVKEALTGHDTIACTVVGFPLGATTPEAIAAESESVVQRGATEVDMVIPVGSMREDDLWTVYRHVKAVCDAVHERGASVKVILEAHFLTVDQLAVASLVSIAAGADFIKTSTGFAPSGAKVADVALMAAICPASGAQAGGKCQVKAAGGIRSRQEAIEYIRYGASRIGTSSGVKIVGEQSLN